MGGFSAYEAVLTKKKTEETLGGEKRNHENIATAGRSQLKLATLFIRRNLVRLA